MKKILHRIASALAERLAGLADLRRDEQQIYRDALQQKLAGSDATTEKEQQEQALNWQDALTPVEN